MTIRFPPGSEDALRRAIEAKAAAKQASLDTLPSRCAGRPVAEVRQMIDREGIKGSERSLHRLAIKLSGKRS